MTYIFYMSSEIVLKKNAFKNIRKQLKLKPILSLGNVVFNKHFFLNLQIKDNHKILESEIGKQFDFK